MKNTKGRWSADGFFSLIVMLALLLTFSSAKDNSGQKKKRFWQKDGFGIVCFLSSFCVGFGCFIIFLGYDGYMNGTLPAEARNITIESAMEIHCSQGIYYLIRYKTPSGESPQLDLGFNVRVFSDVAADQPNWAMLKPVQDRRGKIIYRADNDPNCYHEIHLHSASELFGGWNYGKFGSGQATVLK